MRWVPVTHAYPTSNDLVLVCDCRCDPPLIALGQWIDDEHRWRITTEDLEVTHWYELPSSPQDVTDLGPMDSVCMWCTQRLGAIGKPGHISSVWLGHCKICRAYTSVAAKCDWDFPKSGISKGK
jgi:hypothetical protein